MVFFFFCKGKKKACSSVGFNSDVNEPVSFQIFEIKANKQMKIMLIDSEAKIHGKMSSEKSLNSFVV